MRTLEELERSLRRSAAYAQTEYVDVVFGEAGVDVVVPHTLRPSHPEQVIYEVVRAEQAALVYQDGSTTRRPWGDGYIVLRSDVTNARVRLRLAAEHNTPVNNQITGAPGSPASPPPVTVPFLVEHNPDGTHSDITADSVNATGAISSGTLFTAPSDNVTTIGDATHTMAKTWGGVFIGRRLVPAQLTGNTNDWAPPGLATASLVIIDATTPLNLTGIDSTGFELGRPLILYNASGNTVTLPHESGSSSAANRFFFANGLAHTLIANQAITFIRETGRWILLSVGL